jgi:hypothetical protein
MDSRGSPLGIRLLAIGQTLPGTSSGEGLANERGAGTLAVNCLQVFVEILAMQIFQYSMSFCNNILNFQSIIQFNMFIWLKIYQYRTTQTPHWRGIKQGLYCTHMNIAHHPIVHVADQQ